MTRKVRRNFRFHLYFAVLSWTHSLGNSEEQRCGKPGRTSDSQYSKMKLRYNINEEVQYTCMKGGLIPGFSVRQCFTNGSWSGTLPVCYNPAEIYSARLSSEEIGRSAAFTIDGNVKTCISTELWDFDPFWEGFFSKPINISIVKVTFPSNETVNVEIIVKNQNDEDVRCGNFSGYAGREGSHIFWCPLRTYGNCIHIRDMSGGNHPLKICEVAVFAPPDSACIHPDIPFHGYGSKAVFPNKTQKYSFFCENGYQLWGDVVVHCQSDGTWTPRSPMCKRIYCSPPDHPQNGTVSYDHLNGKVPHKGKAVFSCDDGFILSGTRTVTCERWESWSPALPVCKEIIPRASQTFKVVSCNTLPQIANGALVVNSTVVGSTAWLKCNEGFRPVSSSKIQCQSNGEWDSPASLNCAPIQCDSNPAIRHGNGILLDHSTFYGSRLQITCQRGYVAQGSDAQKPIIRMCEKSGTWGDLNICIIVTCGTLYNEETNGGIWEMLNESVSFRVLSCPEGYHIEGSPAVVQCLSNSSWSHSTAKCLKAPEANYWGSDWTPAVIMITAVAIGAGSALSVLTLAMVFLVIKKRRQARTNTTVFHLEMTDSPSYDDESKVQIATRNSAAQIYFTPNTYEDVVEVQKSRNEKPRKPQSALPRIPYDADPVYAQPFEASSESSKKVSNATNKDDIYTAHIYAEPIDSRKIPFRTTKMPNRKQAWFNIETGNFGRKISLPDCSNHDKSQNTTYYKHKTYTSSTYSPVTLSSENGELYEKSQSTETENKAAADAFINNSIYFESDKHTFPPGINLEQIQMFDNDIYLDKGFSNV